MNLFARLCAPALCGLLALAAAPAGAQDNAAQQDLGALSQQWLDQALQRLEPDEMPLRMEVSVGQLDPRLRLAPCARVEPYLPRGARLWGRTRLGLRCVEGQTHWNVFLPITVKAWGPAWVLVGNVSTGAALTEQDVMQTEVDWAAETAAVLANPQGWLGKVAARPLVAGQALRQGMVRAPELFKAGASVRVLVQGAGFSVTSSGRAMNAGAAGESVRIRMTNGRVVGGTVQEDGTVEAVL